jgi:hypothetical protein
MKPRLPITSHGKVASVGVATKAPRRTKPLVWTGDSTCFDDLRYSGGSVYATFTDGTQYIYPSSKAEAREWFQDESVGKYFNAFIR